MEFLEHQTNIPSPCLFDWACESDPKNEIGVGYILMEKLNGRPLDWQGATTAQRQEVVQQLADVMIEIEKYSFDKLGSLVATGATEASESQIQVQGLANCMLPLGEDGIPLGPFCSWREALRAIIKALLFRMITTGEMGTTENATDLFLAHRYRLDILDSAWKPTVAAEDDGEKFFLKHADDNGDHIFVNADFDIVGIIIDWEGCSTASKEEAFSSPCMMWPVAAFYDGSNELADEEVSLAGVFCERGREDLARCVLDGRRIQRFLFALRGSLATSDHDNREFASLSMGLIRAFSSEEHGLEEEKRGGAEEEEWEAWKERALKKWKHEDELQIVLKSVGTTYQ